MHDPPGPPRAAGPTDPALPLGELSPKATERACRAALWRFPCALCPAKINGTRPDGRVPFVWMAKVSPFLSEVAEAQTCRRLL